MALIGESPERTGGENSNNLSPEAEPITKPRLAGFSLNHLQMTPTEVEVAGPDTITGHRLNPGETLERAFSKSGRSPHGGGGPAETELIKVVKPQVTASITQKSFPGSAAV